MGEIVRGRLWCYAGGKQELGESVVEHTFVKVPIALGLPETGHQEIDLNCQHCGKPLRVAVRSRRLALFGRRLQVFWACLLAAFGVFLLIVYLLLGDSPDNRVAAYFGGGCLLVAAGLIPFTLKRCRQLVFTDYVFLVSGAGRTVLVESTPWKEHTVFD